MNTRLLFSAGISACLVINTTAAPPGIISHQGRITVDGVNFDGTGHFKFALLNSQLVPARAEATVVGGEVTAVTVTHGGSGYFTAPSVNFTSIFGSGAEAEATVVDGQVTSIEITAGGSGYNRSFLFIGIDTLGTEVYWQNSPGGIDFEPGVAVSLPVSKGHYSVGLGDTAHTGMTTSIPPSAFDHEEVYLRIWFSPTGDSNSYERLAPDRRLTSVGYAFNAEHALNSENATNAQNALNADALGGISADAFATSGQLYNKDSLAADLSSGNLDLVRLLKQGSFSVGLEPAALPGAALHLSGATGYYNSAPSPQHLNTILDGDDDGQGGTYELTGTASVAVLENLAIVLNQDQSTRWLTILDITDPSSPLFLRKEPLTIPVLTVAAAGRLALLGTTGGIRILDFSVPTAPVQLSTTLHGHRVNDIAIAGNLAYVSSNRGFSILDISDPVNPLILSLEIQVLSLPSTSSVAVSGQTAIHITSVFSISPSKVSFLDISNPGAPAVLATIIDGELNGQGGSYSLEGATDVAIRGSLAFVLAQTDDTLTIIDFSNPASPRHLATVANTAPFQLNRPTSISVSGNTAFVTASDSNALTVIDVSDPTNPSHLATVAHGDATGGGDNYALLLPSAVATIGTTAIVTAQNSASITTIDFSGGLVPVDLITENRVGIGTARPETDVHVFGASDPTLKIQSDGDREISGRVSLRQKNDSGIDFYYDGTAAFEGLRIDPYAGGSADPTALYISNRNDGTRGNVGIGTTEPATKFAVDGEARFSGEIGAGAGAGGVDTADFGYNFFAAETPSPESGQMSESGDVYVGQDLEVEETVYAREIVLGEEEGNHRIYFFEDGRRIGESLLWADESDTFIFSDRVEAEAFVPTSDRDAKKAFEEIDADAVLAKVAALPITTWQFKSEDDRVRHIGPVAQDFYRTFEVGYDDKHIATVDADGVALAAIQALNAKVEARESRIHVLEKENAKLKEHTAAILDRLERLEKKANTE